MLVVEKDGDTREAMRKLAEIGSAGFAAGLTLAIFLLGGYYADKFFGTGPLFILIGIALGLVGSFYTLLKSVLSGGKGRGK
ncbi:MAG: hypothetical protein Kow00107_04490 [Planctomycetota bacterium]